MEDCAVTSEGDYKVDGFCIWTYCEVEKGLNGVDHWRIERTRLPDLDTLRYVRAILVVDLDIGVLLANVSTTPCEQTRW